MEGMKQIKETAYQYKGFGFWYMHALTEKNETIKGGSLYLFGKQMMTLAISNGDWTDGDGKPYKFKFVNRVLFIKKWAIGFRDKKKKG